MNQEDKELSFIDISGRLHYGVIVNYKESEYDHRKWKITTLHVLHYSKNRTLIDTDYDGWISYEEHQGCSMSTGSRPFRFGEVLPYLRSLSSMTEEEILELYKITYDTWYSDSLYYKNEEWINFRDSIKNNNLFFETCVWLSDINKVIDWFLKNHFDYRGLIPMGLAIAVTKENNPYANN